MDGKKYKVTIRSIVLSMIVLINSLVLYVPNIYFKIYDYYTIIAIFELVLAVFAMTNFRFETKSMVMALLIVVIAFIDIFFNKLPIGEYFPLIWFFVLMYCFGQLEDREIFNSLFSTLMIVFWLYLMVYSVIHHSDFELMINTEIVQGILNPNTVGSGIAQFSLLQMATHVDKGSSKINKGNLIVGLASLFGIYMSSARAVAMFYGMSIILYVIIMWKGFKRKKLSKVFFACLIMAGYIFPFVIISLFNKYGFGTMFLGKSLFTGRERIWSSLFRYMKEHPMTYVFGAGKVETLFWHGRFNLHSSYLALFTEYGLIVSILFWALILYTLYKKIDIISDLEIGSEKQLSKNVKATIGFIAFVIYSMFLGYTETNYTYILSLIYIAMALGILSRSSS